MTWSPSGNTLLVAAGWLALTLILLPSQVPGTVLGLSAALACGLAAIDWILCWREPAAEVSRELPARSVIGTRTTVVLRVQNPSRRDVSVRVLDAPPREIEAEGEQLTIDVGPGGTASGHYAIRPLRRGDHDFGRGVAFSASPLRLWHRRIEAHGDHRLRVYPDAHGLLRSRALDPRKLLERLGAKVSPRRGEGLDFESLRDYVPGDDPRRLDWAASARRGRPVVRQYQHERNHNVVIALDSSRLMAARIAGRTKLDYAVDAALVLGYAGLVSGDRVAMALFDDRLHGFLAPRCRRADFGAMLDFLRPAQPQPVEPNFQALVRGLAARQRQRSLVVVLTDFVELEATPLLASLAALARHHRVLLVALRDPLLNEVHPRAPRSAGGAADFLRRIVLGDLAHHRQRVLLRLQRAAVQTLDLAPSEVTGETLNRYLALRQAS